MFDFPRTALRLRGRGHVAASGAASAPANFFARFRLRRNQNFCDKPTK